MAPSSDHQWSHQHVGLTLFPLLGGAGGAERQYGMEKQTPAEALRGLSPPPASTTRAMHWGFDDNSWRSPPAMRPSTGIIALTPSAIFAGRGGRLSGGDQGLSPVFVTGHPEYDALTLDGEPPAGSGGQPLPVISGRYYPDNTRTRLRHLARSHGHLLFSNWLNCPSYQLTSYKGGKTSARCLPTSSPRDTEPVSRRPAAAPGIEPVTVAGQSGPRLADGHGLLLGVLGHQQQGGRQPGTPASPVAVNGKGCRPSRSGASSRGYTRAGPVRRRHPVPRHPQWADGTSSCLWPHQLPERGPHRPAPPPVIRVSTRRHRPAATGQGVGPWGPAGCRGRGEQELAVEPWNVQAQKGWALSMGFLVVVGISGIGIPRVRHSIEGPEAMSICVVFGPVYGQSLKNQAMQGVKMRNLDQLDLDILAHLFRDAGMTNKFGCPGRGGAVPPAWSRCASCSRMACSGGALRWITRPWAVIQAMVSLATGPSQPPDHRCVSRRHPWPCRGDQPVPHGRQG